MDYDIIKNNNSIIMNLYFIQVFEVNTAFPFVTILFHGKHFLLISKFYKEQHKGILIAASSGLCFHRCQPGHGIPDDDGEKSGGWYATLRCCWQRADYGCPAPGGLGGTYAGNPLAIAAAHAVLNIIDKEALCERAQALGRRLTATLEEAKSWCPALAEVRGVGSMIAAEFFPRKAGSLRLILRRRSRKRRWNRVGCC